MADYIKILFSFPLFINLVNKYNLQERFTSLVSMYDYLVKLFPMNELDKIRKDAEISFSKTNKLGIKSIDYFDPIYPEFLKQIYKPPIVLFYIGDIDLLKNQFLGIVGTRKPSRISVLATNLLVEKISGTKSHGIISGLANGIDREAMFSAIQFDLPLVGVLGTGLEKKYPKTNSDLYNKMLAYKKSLFISEMRVGEKIGVWSFPKRNRIISGISNSIFLMEAPKKSGAISTAYHAIEQSKELIVFDDKASLYNEGGKKLIEEGAVKLSINDLIHKNSFFHISDFYSNSKSFEETPSLFAKLNELETIGEISSLGGGYYKKNLSS